MMMTMMITRNARGRLIDNGSTDPTLESGGRLRRAGGINNSKRRTVRSKRRSAGYRSVKRGMTVVLVVIFCLFKLLTSREEW